MEHLDLFLLFIAVIIGFSITKEIFTIRKTPMSEIEAKKFFENLCNVEDSNLGASIHTTGLALAKSKKAKKYDLIPQSKLCGLGLS